MATLDERLNDAQRGARDDLCWDYPTVELVSVGGDGIALVGCWSGPPDRDPQAQLAGAFWIDKAGNLEAVPLDARHAHVRIQAGLPV